MSRQKDLTLAVKEGVDTLLMYLYRALNYVDEMEKLASSENYCIVVCALFWLISFGNHALILESYPSYIKLVVCWIGYAKPLMMPARVKC